MTDTSNREIIQERLLPFPQDLVWKAWADAKHADIWWGPKGFQNTTSSMEFKVGGAWTYTMLGPDGKVWPNRIEYLEIQPFEKLHYIHGSSEADREHFRVTVTFEKKGDHTLLRMRSVFPTAEARDFVIREVGALEGGKQTLGRLESFLHVQNESKDDLVIERTFAAPLSLLWKAHSDEQALAKWWGPKELEMFSAKLDFRAGGFFHYGMRSPDGNEMWGRFDYLHIQPTTQIVFLNAFSDREGNLQRAPFFDGKWALQTHNTLTFSEVNGHTKLVLRGKPWNATGDEHALFQSIRESMNEGFGGTFDQLEEFLKREL